MFYFSITYWIIPNRNTRQTADRAASRAEKHRESLPCQAKTRDQVPAASPVHTSRLSLASTLKMLITPLIRGSLAGS